jgi:hypothetical protein
MCNSLHQYALEVGRTVPARRLQVVISMAFCLAAPITSHAYPEFQQDIVKRTGRIVNCAMCHSHSDGPEGTAPGQIGSFSPEELQRLGQARGAMEPGVPVDSPILNDFGNHIVTSLGKKRVVELKMAPDQLSEQLPADSDMDHDGIMDVQELRDGTHPLISSDGRPWLLFKHNLAKNRTSLLLALVATVLGLYGLHHLLIGFARHTQIHPDEEKEH